LFGVGTAPSGNRFHSCHCLALSLRVLTNRAIEILYGLIDMELPSCFIYRYLQFRVAYITQHTFKSNTASLLATALTPTMACPRTKAAQWFNVLAKALGLGYPETNNGQPQVQDHSVSSQPSHCHICCFRSFVFKPTGTSYRHDPGTQLLKGISSWIVWNYFSKQWRRITEPMSAIWTQII
jgi:hypothetical protein